MVKVQLGTVSDKLTLIDQSIISVCSSGFIANPEAFGHDQGQ
jgi:hypothetical protein